MNEIPQLVSIIVRATRAKRVLEIGTRDGISGLAIAEALGVDGLLISLDKDPAAATAARNAFAGAGYAPIATVMLGDATRYLHKIAGPFDVVFQNSNATQYEAMHEGLVRVLAPSATLITHGTAQAGRYNEVLAADARLTTVTLAIGDGLAISVRRQAATEQ
jgi:predicted O-methyltransferase YrrM